MEPVTRVVDAFGGMPALQLVFVLLFLAIPSIGINMVINRSNKRVGRNRGTWNPFVTIGTFNQREWAQFGFVIFLTAAAMAAALMVG